MPSHVTPNVGAGRIMVTDTGPHPPELWAQVVADELTDTGMNMEPGKQAKALRLRADILDALTPHFENVAQTEQSKLQADSAHLMTELNPTPHVDDVIAAIQKAAEGTPWEGHFSDPDKVALIGQLVATHVASAQHVERSWHADRNPTDEHAMAFRDQHHPPTEQIALDDVIADQVQRENIANGGAPSPQLQQLLALRSTKLLGTSEPHS